MKPSFPPGWHSAEAGDYLPEDLSLMNNCTPNHVEADFNGDGSTDQAWLLLNKTKNKFGVFIFLGTKNGRYKTVKYHEYPKEGDKLLMGISLIEPGKFKTACGKGYWDCARDEPEVLSLKYPSIEFFMFESAHSVIYWNLKKQKFERIWLSD